MDWSRSVPGRNARLRNPHEAHRGSPEYDENGVADLSLIRANLRVTSTERAAPGPSEPARAALRVQATAEPHEQSPLERLLTPPRQARAWRGGQTPHYFLSAGFFSAVGLEADFAIDVVGTMMCAYGVPFHITHGPPLVQSVGYASS